MALKGMIPAEMRLPLVEMASENRAKLEAALVDYGL